MRWFAFRLAGFLKMTVRELLDRMDAREFAEWIAFYNIEPFGDEWRMAGMQAATTANCAAFRKGNSRQIEEFMPLKQREQTPAESRNVFAGLGNKIIKQK